MNKHLKISAWIFFILLVLMSIGWVFAAMGEWQEIVSRPSRLSQLISDVLVVVVPGVVACLGLWAGKGWAKHWFAGTLGAALYAFVFNVSYLRWDNYFGGPWIIALLFLVVFIAYVIYAFWALRLKWNWLRGGSEGE